MTENDDKGPTQVKTRVRPDTHARLSAYAARTHRSISSAAAYLITVGLDREAPSEQTPTASAS